MRGWLPIWALGLVTITSYGAWFYSFGVLIDPIGIDTGWSESQLGGIFGISQLVFAVGAPLAGRLLDRAGAVAVFAFLAIVGAGSLAASSFASSVVSFGVLAGFGGGVISACGFYGVTTATAARVGPNEPAGSISALTLIGAFCSPIYLPFVAWLVERMDWRDTVRVLALLAAVGGVIAALSMLFAPASTGVVERRSSMAAIAEAMVDRSTRMMVLATFSAAIAYTAVLVYQVPIMQEVGLTLTAAAGFAGARGLFQFFGRLGIGRVVARVGARTALRGAYLLGAIGILALVGARVWIIAAAFSFLAGVALGAASPLQAIYAHELFDEDELGTLMGAQTSLTGLAGGIGPFVGGLLATRLDTRIPIVWLSVAVLAVAIIALRPVHRPVLST